MKFALIASALAADPEAMKRAGVDVAASTASISLPFWAQFSQAWMSWALVALGIVLLLLRIYVVLREAFGFHRHPVAAIASHASEAAEKEWEP